MVVDILIVSFSRDLALCEYAIRSLEKYATGFRSVKIVIPNEDLDKFLPLERYKTKDGAPVLIKRFWSHPTKGMLHHEAMIMQADAFNPGGDLVLHADSDCIFTQPFSPETYMTDGKPNLLYQSYESLERLYPGHPVQNWKKAAEAALNMPCPNETMRRHPAMHWHDTYRLTRKRIETVHEIPMVDYVLSGRDAYPQSVAEFPTLGAYAMYALPERYHLIDVEHGWPDIYSTDSVLEQGWSRFGNSPEHKRKLALQTKAWERFLAGDREGGRAALNAMNDRSHG